MTFLLCADATPFSPLVVNELHITRHLTSALIPDLLPSQMHFLLLFSKQGKLRLQKWFTPTPEREKKKVIRDMLMLVLARPPRSCNFLQWRDLKIVYKRWITGQEPCIIILSSNYKIFLSVLSHPAAAGAGLSAGTTCGTAHA